MASYKIIEANKETNRIIFKVSYSAKEIKDYKLPDMTIKDNAEAEQTVPRTEETLDIPYDFTITKKQIAVLEGADNLTLAEADELAILKNLDEERKSLDHSIEIPKAIEDAVKHYLQDTKNNAAAVAPDGFAGVTGDVKL